jgi:transposase
MLYAGLDLSRQRVDVHLMDEHGEPVQVTTAPPDVDGLRGLARQVAELGAPVLAAIESMNGARFVHDQLELAGWRVAIADAQKVKGLAPLACKTDRIDAWVLAELCRRELVPVVWLPTPGVRAERERARWRPRSGLGGRRFPPGRRPRYPLIWLCRAPRRDGGVSASDRRRGQPRTSPGRG